MTVNLLIAYAHRDISSAHEILRRLSPLQQQGVLGKILEDEVSLEDDKPDEIALRDAHIILLLVSPDFLNSDYCYSPVMKTVIDQHKQGRKVRVIPAILRPVYWQKTPFSRLPVVPYNAKPITMWNYQDEALNELISFIHNTIATIDKQTLKIKRFSLLIVDNDYEFVERLLSIFRNDSFTVLHTADADQAIALWQEQEPDVALISTSLHGEDSLTLLKAMRLRERGGICAISSVGTTLGEKTRWFAAGVDDFITRPIDPLHLLARLRLLLRIKHLSDSKTMKEMPKSEGKL